MSDQDIVLHSLLEDSINHSSPTDWFKSEKTAAHKKHRKKAKASRAANRRRRKCN